MQSDSAFVRTHGRSCLDEDDDTAGLLQGHYEILDLLESLQLVPQALFLGPVHSSLGLIVRAVVHRDREPLFGNVQGQVLR